MGSHVADALSEAGTDVRIFDLHHSKYLREDQRMISGDILDEKAVLRAVAGCDYVYNFAGISDLDDATTKPMDTINLNIVGNNHIAGACLEAGVKRLIYASTIYVYSQRGGFYRCSKQAAELYVEEYQRHYGLDFTILRYSTLYGPRADERNGIYRYLKEALLTGKVTTSGSGNEVRDYLHVRDAANLSVDILSEKYRNKHIIISGHHPMAFQNMVKMLEEILGKDVKVMHSPKENLAHYDYTPYSFSPKIGHKLTHNVYLDLGQGLLECLHEIHNELETDKKIRMLTS